jgi:site-specific DNA recombinase
VIPLAEYRRRRGELERKGEALEGRQRRLTGVAGSVEDFCARVRSGLADVTFEQRRRLVELLIDRVIVTDDEVEIRYVIPTDPSSEHVRFCHLRTDYSAYPQAVQEHRELPGHGHHRSFLGVLIPSTCLKSSVSG